jgi:hypothetical protein
MRNTDINSSLALAFTGIRLLLENTLVTLRRLQPDDSVVTCRTSFGTLPFSLPSYPKGHAREGFMRCPASNSTVIRALGFGFETGPSFLASTVFQGQPDIGSNEIFGIKRFSELLAGKEV